MSSLSDFLTKIANSIRKVKGTNAQINAQNFSTEIEKMKIGGNNGLQWKCDNMKKLDNEFYNYRGTSLDEPLTGLDTSNVTSMYSMFMACLNLTSIPQLDTSNVTDMGQMFNNCINLTSIPQLNTSNVTGMNNMFNGCKKLTSIPQLDMSKATSVVAMFMECINLTNLQLQNVKVNLQIGSGTSWGHLLTIDSLIGLCKECVKQSSSRTLTVGSANMEKLANVYVKFTDSAQTTIDAGAKGENIVQCESTDEGAMTINDYMTLKNWSLA